MTTLDIRAWLHQAEEVRTTCSVDLDIVNDHLVARDVEGHGFLVDTGSPVTILPGGPLQLPGLNLERLGELVGTPLDGLIGMETLGRQPFLIDWIGRRLVLAPGRHDRPRQLLVAPRIAGLPVVPLTVAGRERRVILDTGAPRSYFLPEVLESLEPCGQFRDFYVGPAGLPEFDSTLYRGEARLGSRLIRLNAGLPPDFLQDGFRLMRVDGVVGADVFRDRRVLIDFRRSQVRVDDEEDRRAPSSGREAEAEHRDRQVSEEQGRPEDRVHVASSAEWSPIRRSSPLGVHGPPPSSKNRSRGFASG